MSRLQVVQRQYANHWPLWCVVDGDRVLLCRETEAKAGEMLAGMDKAKGAAEPDTKRGTTRCDDVTASDTPPTLSEIGISKRQSADWQEMEAKQMSKNRHIPCYEKQRHIPCGNGYPALNMSINSIEVVNCDYSLFTLGGTI